jgi:PPM family protein phosphatase
MTSEGTARGPLVLVEIAQLSDTGRVRHHNEDRSLARPAILAVADGMGGAKAGEVAAQVAVDAVGRLGPAVTAQDVRGAVARANRAIRRMASEDPDKSGMGTTLTAALLGDGTLEVVHVGDSRAYLWREGALSQVTEDHSVVAELVRRGSITEEEAETHPHRNVITRALGAEAEVDADAVSAELRDGDVILLCSDGLSSYVPAGDIAGVLEDATDLAAAARELVARANAAGGTDNVTVVLARVGVGGADPGDTAEAPLPPPDGEEHASRTTEMRVLGGVHGHAGAEGGVAARPPKVLEPVRRRRRRLLPALSVVLLLVLVAAGVGGWIASRTYTLQTTGDGTVAVSHGLPWDVFGHRLSSEWQDTGVSAAGVPAAARPSSAHGQGRAVELAVDVVWRYGMPQPPLVTAPAAATAPSPPDREATPGTTTTP